MLIKTRDDAYVHPTTCAYGNVSIGAGVSLWPYSVIRSENGLTTIGAMTNVQDFVMIHGGGVTIGANCSITHHCTIHACRIGNNCLIGINSTVMDGAVIGDNCILAGGAFITEGTIIPPNSIVMGAPGKVRKERNNYVANRLNAWMYHRNALAYARGEFRAWASDALRSDLQAMQRTIEAEFTQLYS